MKTLVLLFALTGVAYGQSPTPTPMPTSAASMGFESALSSDRIQVERAVETCLDQHKTPTLTQTGGTTTVNCN